MHELRKEYIFNRWVIIDTDRAKRPRDFKKPHPKIKEKGKCPFCPGNETMTPPEIARVEEKGKWIFRAFPNKFPAVKLEGGSAITTKRDFFTAGRAYGQHEVVVETPLHRQNLAELRVERLAQLLQLLVQRMNALKKIKGIRYVAVFKNHGLEAGTSLSHEHTQIIAYNKIPSNVERECEAVERYYKKRKRCPYCSIVELERKSPRRIGENSSFAAFAPYASIFAFEAGIFSKKHIHTFSELKPAELHDLALLIKKILLKLQELNAPYNMYFHEAPAGKKHHIHVKVVPRLMTWGGFEHSTGCIINTVSPEQAAEFYRGKK